MKKKLIFLILLFISVTCVFNVHALTCIYEPFYGAHKANGAKVLDDYSEGVYTYCKDQNNCQYLKKVEVTLPGNFDASSAPKPRLFFDINGKEVKVDSGIIKNWSSSFIKEVDIYGNRFINKCPPMFLFRTGAFFNGNKDVSSYLAETRDQLQAILNYGLEHNTWGWQSLIYFTQLVEEKGLPVDEDDTEGDQYSSCVDFTSRDGDEGCLTNKYFSCMWVRKQISSSKTIEYCNFDKLTYVSCGDARDLPDRLPSIISFVFNFIKIITPLILIFTSILTLIKAIGNQKDDELKKAQSSLIKKIIAAALVFFIMQITQFVIFKVAESADVGNMSSCFSCMLNNDCSKSRYYKTSVGGEYQCTYLSDTSKHYDCRDGNEIENNNSSNNSNTNSNTNSKTNSKTNSSGSNNNLNGNHKSSDDGTYSGGGREF